MEQKKKIKCELYMKLNPEHVAPKGIMSSIKHTKTWSFDPEHGHFIIVDGEDVDVQQLIDSYAGMELRSVIDRQNGRNFKEKMQNALDKGLVTPSTYPEDSSITDLTGLPTDRVGVARMRQKAEADLAVLNEKLGSDINLKEYTQSLVDKAIQDYIAKQTAKGDE